MPTGEAVDEDAERLESAKAAAIGGAVALIAALPLALTQPVRPGLAGLGFWLQGSGCRV